MTLERIITVTLVYYYSFKNMGVGEKMRKLWGYKHTWGQQALRWWPRTRYTTHKNSYCTWSWVPIRSIISSRCFIMLWCESFKHVKYWKKSNELIKDFETNDETFDNNVYIKHHCTVLLSNTSHVIILCLQQSIQASKMVVQN